MRYHQTEGENGGARRRGACGHYLGMESYAVCGSIGSTLVRALPLEVFPAKSLAATSVSTMPSLAAAGEHRPELVTAIR